MNSMETLKSKGVIPACYQSLCECGHPLYTNANMTEVMCLSEQCIYRGGNKLAYALKVLGIKSIGVQKSIDLVNLPGVKTHMDVFGIKSNNIKDVESNLLDLPIIPLYTSDSVDGETSISYIYKDTKYISKLPTEIAKRYEASEHDTKGKSLLENSKNLLNLIMNEIYPREVHKNLDIISTRVYNCNNEEQIIENKLHLIAWYQIANKYIDSSYDNLPIHIPQMQPLDLKLRSTVVENSEEGLKGEEVSISTTTQPLNEEEKEIIQKNERTSYDDQWILEELGLGVATLANLYQSDTVDLETLDETLSILIQRLSKVVLNDGKIFLELNPIINYMEQLNNGPGIHFYKYMQMWNFSSIGETYSQKIFMEFTNPEEFYNRFEEIIDGDMNKRELGRELGKWLSNKLNIESYTATVLGIINTMNEYKQDILRVSNYFKFRPGLGVKEGSYQQKPLLVTITNSIATRNPKTGKAFAPRESFIDYCIEEYGVPIIYSKSYTTSIDYIIADDLSGGNRKLKHTEKIISSEDFLSKLEQLSGRAVTQEPETTQEVTDEQTLAFE